MNRKREVLAGVVTAVGYALYTALSTPRLHTVSYTTVQQPPKRHWRTCPQMKDLAVPLLSPSSSVAPPPYARQGFGADLSRSQAAQHRLDDFHELPLQGLGRTVLNEGQHQEVLEAPVTAQPATQPGVRVKFLRWTVRATRDGGTTVSVGGVRFLYGQTVVRDDHLTIWNPHTGDRTPYDGGAWSDANHRMGVFVFSNPMVLTRYQIQTSHESPGLDPVDWTLEGSLNGTYWIPLDVRTAVAAPLERGHWMNFLLRDAV